MMRRSFKKAALCGSTDSIESMVRPTPAFPTAYRHQKLEIIQVFDCQLPLPIAK
jgi:hypothetical protein